MNAEVSGKFLSVAEMSEGQIAAIWNRPVSGFEFRSDLHRAEGGGLPDKWIAPIAPGGEWERVLPMKHADLLETFMRLGRQPTEGRIISFANRYGFLGKPTRLRSANNSSIVGESLTAWRKWAGTVAALYQFSEWIESDNRQAIAPYVEWYSDPLGVAFKVVSTGGKPNPDMTASMIKARPYRWLSRAVPEDAFADGVVVAEQSAASPVAEALIRSFKRGEVIAPAKQYLTWRVNSYLNDAERGVSRIMTPDGDFRYFPKTLLAAIFVRLQDAISGRRLPERECDYWWGRKGKHTFKPTRKDRNFCSESCRKLFRKGVPNGR